MIWELIGLALVVAAYFVGGWVESRRQARAAADDAEDADAEAAGGPRPTVPK